MDARSRDPIGAAIDVLGDRWTLLILRDVMFSDRRHFRALLTGSVEGIASNILADRLVRLVDAGLLARGTGARGQRARYDLTEAGIRTLPIICAMGNWGLDWCRAGAKAQRRHQLLREKGPDFMDELMAELRAGHLESPGDPRPAGGAFEQLDGIAP